MLAGKTARACSRHGRQQMMAAHYDPPSASTNGADGPRADPRWDVLKVLAKSMAPPLTMGNVCAEVYGVQSPVIATRGWNTREGQTLACHDGARQQASAVHRATKQQSRHPQRARRDDQQRRAAAAGLG